MILGIDLGGSAVKLAVLDEGKLVYRAYITNGDESPADIVRNIMDRHGYAPDTVALTGVGAAVFEREKLWSGCRIERVLEADAVSAGTAFLTGESEYLTVSVGTGTAFVLTRNGKAVHIGGSAFGGGALEGLSRKILGGGVESALSGRCARGDLSHVDLLMSELPSCPPTLDPHMTAANLAKTGEGTCDDDWAIGLLNLVMQTIGSMAYLAAQGLGVNTIVFTGGPTSIPETKKIIEVFTGTYGKKFLVPEHSDCAAAIGAAYISAGR